MKVDVKGIQITDMPLSVADLSYNTKRQNNSTEVHLENGYKAQCSECRQVLAQITDSSSLCSGCSQRLTSLTTEPKLNMSANLASVKEQRHHMFLIGIDSVIGFPMFAGIEEELSCYVDYVFPRVTSTLQGITIQNGYFQ